MTPLTQWLKTYIATHLFYIMLIGITLVGVKAWVSEHDARLLSDQAAKAAQVNIVSLQQQIDIERAQAAAAIAVIKAKAAQVKTPAQAIAAIPDVSALPLNARPAPDGGVTVDAVPLFQELAQCKEDAVSLNSCTQQSTAKDQIITAKDAEIKALKKKPSFFHRVLAIAKAVGVGVAIGAVLGAHAW
jgi:hypothetical protein